MEPYKRPVVVPPKFYSESGEEIVYGERWPQGPPEDQYEVVRNPGRFAPLYPITRAIIAYLHEQYEVELLKEHSRAGFGILGATSTGGSVILESLTPGSTSIELHFLPDYGIELHAGHFYRCVFPSCGCEACDETWEVAADDLERTIFAVVKGGFFEEVTPWPHRWRKNEFRFGDGSAGREGTRTDAQERRYFKKLGVSLLGKKWAWQPWQPRV